MYLSRYEADKRLVHAVEVVFAINVQSVRICHIIKGFPAKPAEKEKLKVDLGLTRLAVDRHFKRQIEQHARHLQSTILSKRKSNA